MKLLTSALSAAECKVSLVLETSDNKKFAVNKRLFQQCDMVRDFLEDVPDDALAELPLPEIDSRSLECVFEFLDHHQHDAAPREIERPLRSALKNCIDAWDWSFVEQSLLPKGESSNETLFLVLKAASNLGLAPLRDLCCATVASIVHNKSEDEILAIFGVHGEITPEEEEALRREYPWLSAR